MSQGASKVLLSSVPKNQQTMVDGLVARHLRDTPPMANFDMEPLSIMGD